MLKRKHFIYNPYFVFPLVFWVVGGSIALATQSRTELFANVNARHTPVLDTFMYYSTFMGQAEVIVPVLLGLMALPRFRNVLYFSTAALCNIAPLLVQQALKSYFNEPRPLKFYNMADWIHHSPDWPTLYERSFPSGHSAGAFSFFCFLSLILPARYRALGLVFFSLALLVCYSRMYLAAHFFADTYSGSIIGATTTLAMFALMNYYKGHLFKGKLT